MHLFFLNTQYCLLGLWIVELCILQKDFTSDKLSLIADKASIYNPKLALTPHNIKNILIATFQINWYRFRHLFDYFFEHKFRVLNTFIAEMSLDECCWVKSFLDVVHFKFIAWGHVCVVDVTDETFTHHLNLILSG